MRPLLLACLALLIVAPAARAQDAIGRAAEALRSDPVYVDQQAQDVLSPGEADRVRDRIAEGGAGAVYVAVLPAGGDPEDVASALVDRVGRVGRSGSYAVIVGNRFRTTG